MGTEEQDRKPVAERSEQRTAPRLPVEGSASLFLLKHSTTISCRVVDLSVGGCRIEADCQFSAGLDQRVELSFNVRGLPVRLIGTTRWTDGCRQVGIRFEEMSARRREELLEIVHEVEEECAAAAARRAVELAAETAQAPAAAEIDVGNLAAIDAVPGRGNIVVQPNAAVESPEAAKQPAEPAPLPVQEQPAAAAQDLVPATRDRRAQPRHEVDTSAAIFLVRGGTRLQGRIRDLSLSGCCIYTNQPCPVGIYTRIETEFYLRGIPFRLGGVIQAIHDRRHVGIRFLDVSNRKRQQVENLVAELREMEEIHKAVWSSPYSAAEDDAAGHAEASL